ncbi:hypothetical protein BRD09_04395 [Halobacteriales archaeon SW_10_68_16]|nr:MAG: hypothetical protein BRD09_04395 [Halobacteriales archaeon SW_10_68_16]
MNPLRENSAYSQVRSPLPSGVQRSSSTWPSSDDSALKSDVAGDPERLVCPNGHQTWERTAERFWCYDCSRIHDVDPVFDELETGQEVLS